MREEEEGRGGRGGEEEEEEGRGGRGGEERGGEEEL